LGVVADHETEDTLPATDLATVTSVGSAQKRGEAPAPQRVGRYELLERVGAGGMGVVHRARDPDLERDVAIKLLRVAEESSSGSRPQQQRMLREAQAMARLSHPNIVPVFDVGTSGDAVFIAMEFVEGHTLKKWLSQTDAAWPARLAKVLEAGEGLAAAHEAGVVHRDFKPDNVLIGPKGRARVADFGLARGIADAPEAVAPSPSPLDVRLTQTGAIIGTPLYMAAEQHNGEVATAATDQFAFAVVAFEAIYGERPFRGEGLAELAIAVTEGDIIPPPPDTDVPDRVRRALERALDPTPSRRFSTLHELLAALAISEPDAQPTRWPLYAAVAFAVAGVGVAAAVTIGASRSSDPAASATIDAAPIAAVGSVDAGPLSIEQPTQAFSANFAETMDYDRHGKTIVQGVVSNQSSDLSRCYEAERADAPDLEGKVTIRFNISSYGTVIGASVVDSDFPGRRIGSCVAAAALMWTFPKPADGEPVEVAYPITFAPPFEVRRGEDGVYEVEFDTFERARAHPDRAVHGARLVPSIRDGKANGFKLYAIAAASVFDQLGLQNGDTVTHLNDMPLDIERFDELIDALGDADKILIRYVRRGEPQTIEVRVKMPPP
jgi:serine/threonine protein kinase